MLNEALKQEIEKGIGTYEIRQAACIDALKAAQRQRGWVSDEDVLGIADLLEMSPAEVDGVATFYNLIFRRPVGRNVILLCDSVSCWIEGYEALAAHLRSRLGISWGQTTRDGLFTLLPVPCLGACHRAPALLLNGELHERVDIQKLDELLDSAVASASEPRRGSDLSPPPGGGP